VLLCRWSGGVLCYVMLCYLGGVECCYVILSCLMLCYVMLCYVIFCHIPVEVTFLFHSVFPFHSVEASVMSSVV